MLYLFRFMSNLSSERVRAVVLWLTSQTGKKQKEIGVELGYQNRSHFSQILNGIKAVPNTLPGKIASLDSRINLNYLLGLSDDMLIGENGTTMSVAPEELTKRTKPTAKNHSANVSTEIIAPHELMKIVEDLTATVRSQQDTIKRLLDEMKPEKPGVSITNIANNTNK